MPHEHYIPSHKKIGEIISCFCPDDTEIRNHHFFRKESPSIVRRGKRMWTEIVDFGYLPESAKESLMTSRSFKDRWVVIVKKKRLLSS